MSPEDFDRLVEKVERRGRDMRDLFWLMIGWIAGMATVFVLCIAGGR